MLRKNRNTRLMVTAGAVLAAGAATLAWVELSVGRTPAASDRTDKPAVQGQVARPEPVVLEKPVDGAAPAAPRTSPRPETRTEVAVPAVRVTPALDIRPEPVEVVPALPAVTRRTVAPVRPAYQTESVESATEAARSRTGVMQTLGRAEDALFRGDLAAARRLLADVSAPGMMLREGEVALHERLTARLDAAARIVGGDFAVAANVLGAAPAAAAAGDPAPAVPAAPAGEAPALPAAPAPDAAPGLLDSARQFDDIIRDQVVSEFKSRIVAAESLLGRGSFDLADQTVVSAVRGVQENARFLVNNGQDLLAQADALRNRIREQRTAEELRRKQLQERLAVIRSIDDQNREQTEKNERIRRFLRNAEDAVREGDPALALENYDLVLRIDPANVAANARKAVVSDMYDRLVKHGIDSTIRRQETFQNIDALEGRIPWYHEVRLPADWDELSRRRLEQLSEDEDPAAIRERQRLERAARRLLNMVKPTLNLPGIPLNQAIEFIKDIWGANIVVNYEALAGGGIDVEKLINLPNLKDISLRGALELIFDQISPQGGQPEAKPGYIVDAGVIIISTNAQLAERTASVVYDISDLILVERIPTDPQQVQLSQFSQGSGVFQQGTAGGGAGGQGGNVFGGGGAQQQDFTAQQEQDTRDRLITDVQNLIRTVDPATFASGNDTGGDAPGQMREFLGSLVIRQTRANHDKIARLLNDLRSVAQKQVSIDVRFVQIDAAVVEQVVFDFDVDLSNIFSNAYRNRGSFLTSYQNGPSQAAYRNPFTQVQAFQPSRAHPTDLLAIDPSTLEGPAGGFGSSQAAIQNTAVGIFLSGAIIDDISVRFFLQATQASNRVSIFTAPKVTLLNGRKATIAIREFQPYVANIRSNTGGQAVGVDPQIQIAEDGTTMWVRAVISHDNRFVTMQLNPVIADTDLERLTNGDFNFQVQGQGAGGGGGGGNGNVFQQGAVTIQQPRRKEQNVLTTVRVPDKGTVVLGGFKATREVERELGVPILSKIPVVKRLFSNRAYGRDDSVLVILVRPTIHLYSEIDPFHDRRPAQN